MPNQKHAAPNSAVRDDSVFITAPKAIGITGGICSGKSQVLNGLGERLGAEFLSADQIVHELYQSDTTLQKELLITFGSEIFTPSKEINRPALRRIIFASPQKRRILEKLIHPRVREVWLMHRDRCRKNGRHFLIEIPLLYETDAHKELDMVIVVAASASVQIERLSSKRGLSENESASILRAQTPILEQIAQANIVLWNDGSLEQLYSQIDYTADLLRASS